MKIEISIRNAHQILVPKSNNECMKQLHALYSKGYYDDSPKTNLEYAKYLNFINKEDNNDSLYSKRR